jgi:hypothetical protein
LILLLGLGAIEPRPHLLELAVNFLPTGRLLEDDRAPGRLKSTSGSRSRSRLRPCLRGLRLLRPAPAIPIYPGGESTAQPALRGLPEWNGRVLIDATNPIQRIQARTSCWRTSAARERAKLWRAWRQALG